jgi:hypothetical protein
MRNLVITDISGLRKVLEDVKLMEPVYRTFLPGKVVRAKVKYYEHPGGVRIKGLDGRYWLYVAIETREKIVYDAALWKVINVATLHPTIFSKLIKYIEVG